MGGLKDFAITQYMTEISSVKVVTLTLGHPVVEAEVVSNMSITIFLPYPCTKFVNPDALAPFLMRRTERDPLHCLLASRPSFLADFGWQTR